MNKYAFNSLSCVQVKQSGEVFVARSLDREKDSGYSLAVTATDGTYVAECVVDIEVLDDNDNGPVCDKPSYSAVVAEDVRSGSHVVTVTAHDADEGVNAMQEFYLTGDNANMFLIDQQTGELITALPLDRETVDTYELEAHARDSGVPEWECVSRVTVRVTDVNDNAPVWAKEFTASLKEEFKN